MNKKKLFITVLVLVLLAGLIYLQVRTWRKFDWEKFWAVTRGTNLFYLFAGVGLIYVDYFLRAVRWKILLRPVCQASATRLLAPTMIGFTGLALLGRPGEFIRPYLIARKQGLSMASQVAVWTVERIFDMGAFALIMALNVLIAAPRLKQLPGFRESANPHSFLEFQISGLVLLAMVAGAAAFAYTVRKNPDKAALFSKRMLSGISEKAANAVSHRVHAFGEGLNTVQDFKSFLQLSGISLVIWLVIGLAYVAVTHAYNIHRLERLTLSSVLLLTAASVVGGILQLPAVGGGSQLATIGTLRGVFHFSPELSTSCGMMLWLVTFMSVIPAGLILAHLEHVSFTRLEKESTVEEKKALDSNKPANAPVPPSEHSESTRRPDKWIQ